MRQGTPCVGTSVSAQLTHKQVLSTKFWHFWRQLPIHAWEESVSCCILSKSIDICAHSVPLHTSDKSAAINPYERRCWLGLLGQYLRGVGHWVSKGSRECLNFGCDPIYIPRDSSFTIQLLVILFSQEEEMPLTGHHKHTHTLPAHCVSGHSFHD